jgi:hypothetical protein
MDPLFNVKNATDKTSISLRDIEKNKTFRRFVESLWERFHPLADTGYVNLIATDFQSRFWEMYLGCTLLDAGLSLDSKDFGPDIRIDTKDVPIWVEAISPNAGSGADAVPPQIADGRGGQVPEDQIVLRIRSAIEAKYQVYQNYLSGGIVSPKDPYIIAINGYQIPYSILDDQPSYVVKAVYPFGMHTITLKAKTGEIVGQGFQHRP